MRKKTLNVLALIAHAVITSMAGLTIATWEYWSLLALMVAVQINSSLDGP